MKTLYFFLPLLIIIAATPLSAQDIPEWYLVKMDKLGFIASFYQTPTATTLTEGESTCYSFEKTKKIILINYIKSLCGNPLIRLTALMPNTKKKN